MINLTGNRIIRNEEKASKHINILSHYADDALLDKSGKLIRIFKLSGLNYLTQDDETLDVYKKRRNHLFKNLSSDFAIYTWNVRRKSSSTLSDEYSNKFAKEINQRYQEKLLSAKMFHTELYFALITKYPEGLMHKGLSWLAQLIRKFDKEAKENYLRKRYQDLNEASQRILNAFSDYNCKKLSVIKKNEVEISESLSFLSQLINFDHVALPLTVENAARLLPRKRLFFNARSGTIEAREANGAQKFSAILSIKTYSPNTYQNILNEIHQLRLEYTLTQSYRFYDRQVAKAKMRDQQKEMLQSKEESVSQTDQIDKVFDDTASGEVGYGIHHFTLTCYADTQNLLNHYVGLIVSRFANADITCVREDVASELGFWSQLPGNFSYIARPADISTRNIASFASLYNEVIGKPKGNHWGDAVTIFETLSGRPYYFNFHHKDVGNFAVFGGMGSGKTVLIGFLILQSMKFGGKRVIFDKDRGLEILVRAMNGLYETIKPGLPTGFNPCQLGNTPQNRKFLATLFKKMLSLNGESLNDADHNIIDQAIDGLYRDSSLRQLRHIAPFFGVKKPGSIRARFDEWHSNGTHAWLFDHEEDKLNLNSDVIGFDLHHLLNDEVKIPALIYLTYQVEKSLEGNRGLLFCDEGWRYLTDDYFLKLIEDWSRTPRKKDNIFGLATQAASDTIQPHFSKVITGSAYCKIFFPNPSADQALYIDQLGLTKKEFQLVKTLADDQHYFLLSHGHGINKESVILKLNLDGLDDLIAIISARENTLSLLDQIRHEVGDDPNVWLPIFHERRVRLQ